SLMYQEILKSSYIEQFEYERFTKKQPAYSIENCIQGYRLPQQEYDTFIEYLKERGFEFNERKKKNLLKLIQSDIEAIVGRYYFDRQAYYRVKNRYDDYIDKALKVISPPQSDTAS